MRRLRSAHATARRLVGGLAYRQMWQQRAPTARAVPAAQDARVWGL